MRSRYFLTILVILTAAAPITAVAAAPGEKRTILTSGGKVYTVHYQLGQSTVFHLGFRPETVICGNDNYFHIEKLKDGLTVQPLSNISTNLDVMDNGRWFLFYLTPAKDSHVDAFVDVVWVPDSETHEVVRLGNNSKETVSELGQKVTLDMLSLKLLRKIQIESAKRTILEFQAKNTGKEIVRTSEIEVTLMQGSRPADHQISVFEDDSIRPGAFVVGRLIITGNIFTKANLVLSFKGKGAKVLLSGGHH